MHGERLLDAYIRLVNTVGGVRTNVARLKRRRAHGKGLQLARRALPYLDRIGKSYWRARRNLRAEHERYTTCVSNPGHAISLETAALFYAFLVVMSPEAVIDLGSGFTSYVARLYRAEVDPAVHVTSVDDSPHWMERTRDYLASKGLDTDGLVGPDELGDADLGRYDVVSYDFGSMQTRAEWLDRVLTLARPGGGVVLVDDCHFDDFREQLVASTSAIGAKLHDVRAFTYDRWGRFADLVTDLPMQRSGSDAAGA